MHLAVNDGEVERLLDAAWRVLARGSWHGLTVDAVLAESGLSTRSFYRHFDGKSSLLLALMEDEVCRGVDRLRQIVKRQADPAAGLVAYIEAITRLARDKRTAPRVRLFGQLLHTMEYEQPAAVSVLILRLAEPLLICVEAGTASGRFSVGDPREEALALYYLIGMTNHHQTDGTLLPHWQVVAVLSRVVLAALGVRPPVI